MNQQALGHKRGLSLRSVPDDAMNGVAPRFEVPVRRDSLDVDADSDGDSGGSEHKVKAEAKSIRKVHYSYFTLILNH